MRIRQEPPPLKGPFLHCPVLNRPFRLEDDLATLPRTGKNHTTSVSCLSRRGCTIPFEEKPLLSPVPIFFQHSSRPELEEEVQKLLQTRAVEKVNSEGPGFNSRIFHVPKKERKVKTHNRSDQTEFLCQNPGIQNRNSGYSQTGNSAQ